MFLCHHERFIVFPLILACSCPIIVIALIIMQTVLLAHSGWDQSRYVRTFTCDLGTNLLFVLVLPIETIVLLFCQYQKYRSV